MVPKQAPRGLLSFSGPAELSVVFAWQERCQKLFPWYGHLSQARLSATSKQKQQWKLEAGQERELDVKHGFQRRWAPAACINFSSWCSATLRRQSPPRAVPGAGFEPKYVWLCSTLIPRGIQSSHPVLKYRQDAGKVVKYEAVNRAVKAGGSRWAAESSTGSKMCLAKCVVCACVCVRVCRWASAHAGALCGGMSSLLWPD